MVTFKRRSKTVLSADFILILEEIYFIAIFAYWDKKIRIKAGVQCYAKVALKKWINSMKSIWIFDCIQHLILLKLTSLQGFPFLKKSFLIISRMLTTKIWHYSEICIKWTQSCFSVSIYSHLVLSFLLLTLNMFLFTRKFKNILQ